MKHNGGDNFSIEAVDHDASGASLRKPVFREVALVDFVTCMVAGQPQRGTRVWLYPWSASHGPPTATHLAVATETEVNGSPASPSIMDMQDVQLEVMQELEMTRSLSMPTFFDSPALPLPSPMSLPARPQDISQDTPLDRLGLRRHNEGQDNDDPLLDSDEESIPADIGSSREATQRASDIYSTYPMSECETVWVELTDIFLENRPPFWCPEKNRFVLHLGPSVINSPHNFELLEPDRSVRWTGSGTGPTIMKCAQVNQDPMAHNVDYKAPLSTFLAFAIALASGETSSGTMPQQ